METRRQGSNPFPVRFAFTGAGSYEIWDTGCAIGEPQAAYQRSGQIVNLSGDHGHYWAIWRNGKCVSPWFHTLQEAKDYYLAQRGIVIDRPAPEPPAPLLLVAIPHTNWQHADEWRARVFRELSRNPYNTAPMIERLFVPVARTDRELVFRWPAPLVDHWMRFYGLS